MLYTNAYEMLYNNVDYNNRFNFIFKSNYYK